MFLADSSAPTGLSLFKPAPCKEMTLVTDEESVIVKSP